MSTITTGAIRITAINDGDSRLPGLFYPGLDFARHRGLLAGDGTYHIPTGCFLIQGPGFTVLADAGIGPAAVPEGSLHRAAIVAGDLRDLAPGAWAQDRAPGYR